MILVNGGAWNVIGCRDVGFFVRTQTVFCLLQKFETQVPFDRKLGFQWFDAEPTCYPLRVVLKVSRVRQAQDGEVVPIGNRPECLNRDNL